MQRIRKTGPSGVNRPFMPTIDMNNSIPTDEKQLEVLEHIATSLSAIDHNLELLTKTMSSFLAHYSKRELDTRKNPRGLDGVVIH